MEEEIARSKVNSMKEKKEISFPWFLITGVLFIGFFLGWIYTITTVDEIVSDSQDWVCLQWQVNESLLAEMNVVEDVFCSYVITYPGGNQDCAIVDDSGQSIRTAQFSCVEEVKIERRPVVREVMVNISEDLNESDE